jgi:NADH:ubiquinone oxidoreductase subunit 3 (subunit A)
MFVNYNNNFNYIEYIFILKFLSIALGISLILFLLSIFFVYQKPEREKMSVYECGFQPYGDARNKFEIKFYIIGILFIVFDLEISYLFPFVLSFNYLYLYSIFIIYYFIIILLIGLFFELQLNIFQIHFIFELIFWFVECWRSFKFYFYKYIWWMFIKKILKFCIKWIPKFCKIIWFLLFVPILMPTFFIFRKIIFTRFFLMSLLIYLFLYYWIVCPSYLTYYQFLSNIFYKLDLGYYDVIFDAFTQKSRHKVINTILNLLPVVLKIKIENFLDFLQHFLQYIFNIFLDYLKSYAEKIFDLLFEFYKYSLKHFLNILDFLNSMYEKILSLKNRFFK